MERENKKRILLVEDEATLQRALSDFLVLEDFEVLSALDGERGVELAKSKLPDLILLDIILPKKDGYEVIDELRAQDETRKIPIILLTNLGSSEDVDRAFEKGITTYLVKSDYKLEEVAKKIKEVLKM